MLFKAHFSVVPAPAPKSGTFSKILFPLIEEFYLETMIWALGIFNIYIVLH